jgi:hypothetical protein
MPTSSFLLTAGRLVGKRLVVLLGAFLALSLVTRARAEVITFNYSGTIDRVVDADNAALPTINFTPIPAGSLFSGSFSYNASAPQTGGGTGYARYTDLTPLTDSVTINGFNFATANPGPLNTVLQVVSQEAGFGFSGANIGTQPITLPAGWGVGTPSLPYFTLQFFSIPAQSQSLALPTTTSDFPMAVAHLILDFQQPVTVGGETFGGRVYVIGNITSLSAGPGAGGDAPSPVPEPSTLTLLGLAVAGVAGWRRWRARASS